LMELQVIKENVVLQEELDNKVEKVLEVALVPVVPSVHKVLLEKREMQVKKVHLVLQVNVDLLASAVHQDSKGQKDRKVFPEKTVYQVILDNVVNQVSKEKLVHKVPPV